MGQQRIKIPRAPDNKIASVFGDLARKFQGTPGNVSAFGFASISNIRFDAEPEGEWAYLLSKNSYLVEAAGFTVPGIQISYFRGGSGPVESKSPIYDEITLARNQQQSASTNQILDVVAIINEQFIPFEVEGMDFPRYSGHFR